MSQSDYLKNKRISTQLRIDYMKGSVLTVTNEPPVFTSDKYLQYKQYSLMNTITSTNLNLNRLNRLGYMRIFGIDKKVEGCPTFAVCSNVALRPNRVAMASIYSNPKQQPMNYWRRNGVDVTNTAGDQVTNLKDECKCVLNSVRTDSNICACKRSWFGLVR